MGPNAFKRVAGAFSSQHTQGPQSFVDALAAELEIVWRAGCKAGRNEERKRQAKNRAKTRK